MTLLNAFSLLDLEFNPADYPYRRMFLGADLGARTLIALTDTGELDADLVAAAKNMLSQGGHILIMAATIEARNHACHAISALEKTARRNLQ